MNPTQNIQSDPTKKFHIGVAGLSCECCTFSPLLSGSLASATLLSARVLNYWRITASAPTIPMWISRLCAERVSCRVDRSSRRFTMVSNKRCWTNSLRRARVSALLEALVHFSLV